jgi:hypothetical protein
VSPCLVESSFLAYTSAALYSALLYKEEFIRAIAGLRRIFLLVLCTSIAVSDTLLAVTDKHRLHPARPFDI